MEFSPKKSSAGVNNTYCSVPGCKSKGDKHLTVRFHLFPKPNKSTVKVENKFGALEEVDLLKAWQLKTKIGKKISRSMRICSLHFKQEDYYGCDKENYKQRLQKRYLRKHAVPSCNLPLSNTAANVEVSSERTTRLCRRNILKSPLMGNDEMCVDEAHSSTVMENSTPTAEEVMAAEALCNLLQTTPGQKSFNEIAIQVNTTRMKTVCELIDCNSKLNSLTGLPTLKLLEDLVELVNKFDCTKVYRLNTQEKIILCMTKLKTNLTYVILSMLFGVTSQTCKNVVYKMVKVLAFILKPCIKFPDAPEVQRNMPLCFKNFKNTRVVIDCTEVLLQRPRCLCCRIKCYSQYKSNITLKFMTGVSPAGLIIFVSKAYGGRVSDKAIVEQSGLINLLEMGQDAIMVDKGFLIDTLCEDYNIKLIRPPFLRNKKQLSKEESQVNAAIASARVHVERANQRIKLFQILNSKMQWPLVSLCEDIFIIACAIANLSPPIMADDKF